MNPTEKAIHLCNSITARFDGCTHEEINEEFAPELEKYLKSIGYGCHVIWTPEKEKELSVERSLGVTPKCSSPNESLSALNDGIITLNEHYFSHEYLRYLAREIKIASSRIFHIKYSDDGLQFVIQSNATIESEPLSIDISVPYPNNKTPHQLLDKVKALDKIVDEIREYIESWSGGTILTQRGIDSDYISEINRIVFKNDNNGWPESLKHFALIASFSSVNSYKSATYYLSSLDHSELQSSMVIFWEAVEPSGSVHSVLQQLLSLNITPFLQYHEKLSKRTRIAEVKAEALGHYGHTLKNRIDALTAFLNNCDKKIVTGAIKLHINLLRDLTYILQLNAIEQPEDLLKYNPKWERFFKAEESPADSLDIIKLIKDWAECEKGEKLIPIDDSKHGFVVEKQYNVEFDIDYAVSHAYVGMPLKVETSPDEKNSILKRCRPATEIYRDLIFELMNNLSKYGAKEIECGIQNEVKVGALVHRTTIKHHDGSARELLVISNEVNKTNAERPIISQGKQAPDWIPWPDSIRHNGPGMAIDLIRRLDVGEMFYKIGETRDGRTIFSTGLFFKEMEILQ